MAGASTCKADAGVSETRAKAARTPCTCKRACLENSANGSIVKHSFWRFMGFHESFCEKKI